MNNALLFVICNDVERQRDRIIVIFLRQVVGHAFYAIGARRFFLGSRRFFPADYQSGKLIGVWRKISIQDIFRLLRAAEKSQRAFRKTGARSGIKNIRNHLTDEKRDKRTVPPVTFSKKNFSPQHHILYTKNQKNTRYGNAKKC